MFAVSWFVFFSSYWRNVYIYFWWHVLIVFPPYLLSLLTLLPLGWGLECVYPGYLLGDSLPQTAAKLCALNLFFVQESELQTYHGNILLMDNKLRKFCVIMLSKGCNIMPKMHQNAFGGRVLPIPAGEAYVLPQTS